MRYKNLKAAKVRYQITDKGIARPETTREINMPTLSFADAEKAVRQDHSRYRHAEGLSAKFEVKVLGVQYLGEVSICH